jgi:probable O-glycosylation ligase (exosortase A-associated)
MKGLVLIYAITVLGSLGALRSPVIGLYVYVGFAVLRPQFIWGFAGDFGGISLVIGLATLVGWALNGFGSWKIGPGKSMVVALILFAAWSMLSATQAVDTSYAYAELVPMAKFVMPFLIGITLIDSKARARGMLWVIVLAMGYVSFEMNIDYVVKAYNTAGEGFGGMDNNCFGVALVATIGPALALFMGAKKWWEKGLAAASAGLILHTTLLTFSRGAMVGLLVVGFTAFILMPKRPKHLAVLVVLGLIALRLTGPQLMARYATMVAQEEDRDGSAESRLDLWRDCLKIFSEKPVFGVGPGNFRVVAASLGWAPGKQAHSTWMQALAEVGAPGLGLLLVFFVTAIVKLWPLARAKITEENRYEVAVASGIVMCIVGFVVTGQFVSLGGLEIPYYAVMIGVVLLKQKALAAATAPAGARPALQRATLVPVQHGRFGGPMAMPRPGHR